MATQAQEQAVRDYLTALNNPDSLRDADKVEELRKTLDNTDDPLERVKVKAQLQRSMNISPEDYQDAFIENAKAWAESENVPFSVLQDEGVPDDVLQSAGWSVGKSKSKTTRRTRVSSDDVREFVLSHAEPFAVSDVEDGIGCSYATARKVVNELQQDGKVEEIGEAEDHEGPGRAPTMYKVS